jgi:hypothetical protein
MDIYTYKCVIKLLYDETITMNNNNNNNVYSSKAVHTLQTFWNKHRVKHDL